MSLQLSLLSCCVHDFVWDHIKVNLFTFLLYLTRSSALLFGLTDNRLDAEDIHGSYSITSPQGRVTQMSNQLLWQKYKDKWFDLLL